MKSKKWFLVILSALMFCVLAAGCGTSESDAEDASSDIVVTDMLDREVMIPAGADNFVCIGPGALRLYCYVGDTSKIAGVEEIEGDTTGRPYAIAFDGITELPIIGPGGPNNAPDAEAIMAVSPDVIFYSYFADASAVDELQEKTGIPVVALSYGTGNLFDPDVDTSFSLIGTVTGNEDRAEEVISYFADAKADLTERTQDIAEADQARVYLGAQSYTGTHGIESTTGDYVIFDVLNAVNVVAESGINEYVMLDKEKLLEMDPEYIILDAGGLSLVKEDYDANPDYYQALSAVKNDKVYMQLPFNYYAANLDIALADAYYIGSVLYPEQFADVDPEAKFNEITTELLGAELYDAISETYFGGYQQIFLGE